MAKGFGYSEKEIHWAACPDGAVASPALPGEAKAVKVNTTLTPLVTPEFLLLEVGVEAWVEEVPVGPEPDELKVTPYGKLGEVARR